MTVDEFLEVGEDDNCTDAVCTEDTIASLAGGVYNSLEGNEDSADEANSGMGLTIPQFSSKEALKEPRSHSCAAGHFLKSTRATEKAD